MIRLHKNGNILVSKKQVHMLHECEFDFGYQNKDFVGG